MPLYSHSKLSTFEQCALKFKLKYLDKVKPDYEQSIEAFLGKKVHETLEWLYKNPDKKELDDVIKYFVEKWNQDYNPSIKIVKEEFDKEYYFNKGIKFLINYFVNNFPFKDNTIALEKKIMLNLDNQGEYQLVGFIDRLVHDTEKNIFEIHDYKTGALKSQQELDNDRQLALYSISIRESYPSASEVRLIWHFLEWNQKKISTRKIDELQQLKQEIIALIKKIESSSEFKTNPGILCNWCEYRSYCPEMRHTIKEKRFFGEYEVR